MQMETIERSDAWTAVALRGRLDTAGVDRIETQFNAALAPRGKSAAVDFSEVTFLSSMGVRMLIAMAKTLARKQARMAIVAPQPLVRESLQHAGLDQIVAVAADLEEARRLLQPAGDGPAAAAD